MKMNHQKGWKIINNHLDMRLQRFLSLQMKTSLMVELN